MGTFLSSTFFLSYSRVVKALVLSTFFPLGMEGFFQIVVATMVMLIVFTLLQSVVLIQMVPFRDMQKSALE